MQKALWWMKKAQYSCANTWAEVHRGGAPLVSGSLQSVPRKPTSALGRQGGCGGYLTFIFKAEHSRVQGHLRGILCLQITAITLSLRGP